MSEFLRERYEEVDLTPGQGKITATISIGLGFLALLGSFCLLFPVFRVGTLQRNKDQPQHQQCQDKIIQAGIQAAAIHRWHIQAPGTD